MEECLLLTTLMVASSWALAEIAPHDSTVHICTTVWRRGVIGDSTLSSHKILVRRIWCIATHAYSMITITVIQATILLQVVRKHYAYFTRQDATLQVIFSHSEITLDIPVDGLVTSEGWRITLFSYPTMSCTTSVTPSNWVWMHTMSLYVDLQKSILSQASGFLHECQLIVQWKKR